jgi:energy-coupling factor transporter ATPase
MGEKSTPFIRIRNLQYTYNQMEGSTDESRWALKNISLDVNRGEYVAVIGANGSGKSTLLRHLNALLIPTGGDVWVNSWNTRDLSRIRDIRSAVGMVFQSPDAQIVATVVEEDVAFGPENLGIPRDELQVRVNEALEQVGLWELKKRPTHYLSAGQKQLLAIASALSMGPKCLVLDEATASLDPQSRSRLLQTLCSLNESGMTVISATHRMDEAALAKRIIVLSDGEIALQGHPKHVFSQQDILRSIKLDIPEPMKIARHIASRVSGFRADALTVGELVDAVLAFRGTLGEGL